MTGCLVSLRYSAVDTGRLEPRLCHQEGRCPSVSRTPAEARPRACASSQSPGAPPCPPAPRRTTGDPNRVLSLSPWEQERQPWDRFPLDTQFPALCASFSASFPFPVPPTLGRVERGVPTRAESPRRRSPPGTACWAGQAQTPCRCMPRLARPGGPCQTRGPAAPPLRTRQPRAPVPLLPDPKETSFCVSSCDFVPVSLIRFHNTMRAKPITSVGHQFERLTLSLTLTSALSTPGQSPDQGTGRSPRSL